MGRFLNADAFASTGQGILGNNMFAYCGNNPVLYVDPSGQAFTDIFAVCFGSTASPKITVSSDHQEQSDVLLQYVVEGFIPSNGYSAIASVEYLGVYSKQSNVGIDVAVSIGSKIATWALGLSGLGTVPMIILKGITITASAYSDWSLLNSIKDELEGLANKDYEQYRVVVSWTQTDSLDSIPGAVRYTHYYAEIIFLWNDTRKGEEHWYIQECSIDISQKSWGVD